MGLRGLDLSPAKRALLERRLDARGVAAAGAAPRRADRSRPLPPSLSQEGLYFLDRLHPGGAHQSIPCAVRLEGALDARALERSLGEIVRRHESLRTTFATAPDGLPCQVVGAPGTGPLDLLDLTDLDEGAREAEAVRLATEEARRPFDLARGPLLRTFLIKLSAREHVLVWNVHHIVCDGWSMGVFTRELAALYGAFRQGRASPLSELSVQCADLAVEERRRMQGREGAERLAYWRRRLSPQPPALQLPTARPRPAVQSMRGAHQPLRLPVGLSDALRALSRREGVTPFMTLLAAFDLVLMHATGRTDLVVGTGVANRNGREAEALIGYFVTVLPLRTDVSGNPTFREVLARVRDATLGAAAHAVPLGLLVKELQADRDPSRNPLFQVELTLLTPDRNPAVYGYGLSELVERIDLPDLVLTPMPVEGGVARFDLSVFVWDMPGGFMGTFEYCRDLFEPAFVAGLAWGFEAVLRAAVEAPGARIDALARVLGPETPTGPAGSVGPEAGASLRRLRTARRRQVEIDESLLSEEA